MITTIKTVLSKANSGLRTRGRLVLGLLGILALSAGVLSCMNVERSVMAPPGIPGAEFIGSNACAECHGGITEHFHSATHARLQAKGDKAINMGCESCHGPGSLHDETGGGPRTIINPDRSAEICFQCHLDKKGQFNLPHHHPLAENKVSCSDGHNVHEGPSIKGTMGLASRNDTCVECHAAQRGPYVFEHEAMREGCITCHNPHGSVNDKMLVARNSNLCLKCHFQRQTASGRIEIGGRDHSSFLGLGQGTCWTAGCHEAVHGSHVNSSLRF